MMLIKYVLCAVVILIFNVLSCQAAGAGRTFLIGVDGASWDVMEGLIDKGELPNIKRMMESGCYGPLATDVGSSPITWTSICTGKSMFKHGVNQDDYDWNNYPVIKTKRVWEIVEGMGGKSGVYKMYFLNPENKVLGFRMPMNRGEAMCPAGLEESLRGTDDELLFLIDKFDCRFIAALWYEVDEKQHHFWLYHVMNKAADKAGYPLGLKKEIEDYAGRIYARYREFDKKIGELMKRLKNDDYVVVVSDHGAYLQDCSTKRVRVRQAFLDKVGAKKEWIDENETKAQGVCSGVEFIIAIEYLTQEYDMFPLSVSKYKEKADMPVVNITFNGKEGEELSKARGNMKEKVLSLKQNEERVFALKSETKNGLEFGLSPYCAQYCRKARYPYVFDTEFLEINVTTGDHGADSPGIIIMKGPGLKKGHLIKGAGVFDVVPTLLYMMDLPVGRDMDGNVLVSEFSAPHEVRYIRSYDTGFKESRKKDFGLAENDKRRLRSLGYTQ